MQVEGRRAALMVRHKHLTVAAGWRLHLCVDPGRHPNMNTRSRMLLGRVRLSKVVASSDPHGSVVGAHFTLLVRLSMPVLPPEHPSKLRATRARTGRYDEARCHRDPLPTARTGTHCLCGSTASTRTFRPACSADGGGGRRAGRTSRARTAIAGGGGGTVGARRAGRQSGREQEARPRRGTRRSAWSDTTRLSSRQLRVKDWNRCKEG